MADKNVLIILNLAIDIVNLAERYRRVDQIMQRIIIIAGVFLILIGLLWPWLSKLGLFRLPGDIVLEKGGFRFSFPVTTAILLSVVISLLIWLLRR